MRTKDFKTYVSILAIVNYRNWMDFSPLLSIAADVLALLYLHANFKIRLNACILG